MDCESQFSREALKCVSPNHPVPVSFIVLPLIWISPPLSPVTTQQAIRLISNSLQEEDSGRRKITPIGSGNSAALHWLVPLDVKNITVIMTKVHSGWLSTLYTEGDWQTLHVFMLKRHAGGLLIEE